jgi:hypothetical protein
MRARSARAARSPIQASLVVHLQHRLELGVRDEGDAGRELPNTAPAGQPSRGSGAATAPGSSVTVAPVAPLRLAAVSLPPRQPQRDRHDDPAGQGPDAQLLDLGRQALPPAPGSHSRIAVPVVTSPGDGERRWRMRRSEREIVARVPDEGQG